MPTTEGEHDAPEPDEAVSQRTPIDHPSRRLRTDEIDDLVEAALSERIPPERAAHEVPMPDPYVGVEVDRRYVIESLIAAGGMGLVYRCRHRVLGKKLAIKIIRSDVAHMPDGSERFMLEAKAASSIGNEHIVDIVDFGAMSDGSPFLVMEYLEGISLAALMRKQPALGVSRIAGIASQIAEGLGAAHAAGIVHRDLKPDNVFVLERKGEDFIKVLDFGVARMAQSAKKLTRAGTIVGTPHYMSPEQAMGLEVDHRGDIYALGIILYELIAGRVPFDGDHYVAVLHQHLQAEPPAFASFEPPVDVPLALERVVGRCLAKAPEDRYATMEQLARELAAFRETGLILLGPAGDDEALPVAPSYPPALPAAGLARAPSLGGAAHSPEPLLEPRALPAAAERPASVAPPPAPHQPTLALPRPSGPFTLPQKRFVTSLSVIVLIGVCAVAAFRFGTSQGQRAGESDAVPAPAPPPAQRSPGPAAPPAARAIAEAPPLPAPVVAPEQSAAAPVEPTPDVDEAAASPAFAAGGASAASTGSAEATSNVGSHSAGSSASSESAPAAGRERREPAAGKRSGSSRPASKPRSREEFMNPWPAPRR
jgi:predicted Ser/Thr protein kinase